MLARVLRSTPRVLLPIVARNGNSQTRTFISKYLPPRDMPPLKWHYRMVDPDAVYQRAPFNTFALTLLYYWLLFHFYYDYDKYKGHGHMIPDPLTWTDAELGIPADDED